MMNLEELAQEYKTTADRLQGRIQLLRAQLPAVRGKKAFDMQKRIDMLYTELLDVRTIMGYLNRYYG